MEPILRLDNVHKAYGKAKVIHGISFDVERGDVFGFLGPNGSGKTTTIRMILNLIGIDEGNIFIMGKDNRKEFQSVISQVGAMVETPQFYETLSGYKNIELMANLHGGVSRKKLDEVLELMGILPWAKYKVKTYSLGMRQRLALAMAMFKEPSLVILDEPTNGLDPQGISEIRQLIKNLAQEQGITFFMSTHNLHEVEQVCNKVAILKAGRCIAAGSVKELLNLQAETVEIIIEDTPAAVAILEDLDFVREARQEEGMVIAQVEQGYSPKLNGILVARNLVPDFITPRNNSLESYFLELTKGDDQNVAGG